MINNEKKQTPTIPGESQDIAKTKDNQLVFDSMEKELKYL